MVFLTPLSNQTRPDADRFLHVTQGLAIVSLIILIPIFVLETWGMVQFVQAYYAASMARRGREFNHNNVMLRFFLLLQNLTAISIILQIWVPLYAIPWPQDLNCDAFAILICIQYCISTQVTYLFFLTKAAIVNKVEKNKGRFVYWLNKGTFWGVILFIPFFVIPYAVIRTRGVITGERVCTLFLQDVWFPALFIAGNVALCAALLYLFIRPLNMTAEWVLKNNAGTEEALRMKYVAKKNMVLAMIMAIFSTLSVIGTCIVTALTSQNMQKFDFILQYSYASTVIDLTISSLCARAMTNIWMPPQFKQRLVCISPVSSIEDNSDNASYLNKNSKTASINEPSPFRTRPTSSGTSNSEYPGVLHGTTKVVASMSTSTV